MAVPGRATSQPVDPIASEVATVIRTPLLASTLLALVAVTVGFVYFEDKGAFVLPAIGVLLSSALIAFLVYYWLKLLGSLFVVFADIERNTRNG